MAKTPTPATVDVAPTPKEVKVVLTETTPNEPKISEQTLAEMKAGREALAAYNARK